MARGGVLRKGFESSVKEKDHQTSRMPTQVFLGFESSVKEKDHQTESKRGGEQT